MSRIDRIVTVRKTLLKRGSVSIEDMINELNIPQATAYRIINDMYKLYSNISLERGVIKIKDRIE